MSLYFCNFLLPLEEWRFSRQCTGFRPSPTCSQGRLTTSVEQVSVSSWDNESKTLVLASIKSRVLSVLQQCLLEVLLDPVASQWRVRAPRTATQCLVPRNPGQEEKRNGTGLIISLNFHQVTTISQLLIVKERLCRNLSWLHFYWNRVFLDCIWQWLRHLD